MTDLDRNYVLIDSSGILFHQYYGMKNSTYSKKVAIQGKEIELTAIQGYLNFFKKIKEEFNQVPDKNFIHVLDADGSAYRKALYPAYKATRREKEEELIAQKNLLGLFLQALDEKFVQIPEVEADDVIGSLAEQLTRGNNCVLIVSYDKDLLQLLGDNISLTRHEKVKSMNDQKVFNFYTQDYVYQKYGFPPETMVDFLAFVGDSSDNIPGVKGIGEIAAKELLKKYVNVEGVLANLEEIKPAWKKKIEENVDNLILSKKLALIQKDIKVDLNNLPTINPTLKQNLLKIIHN